MSAVHPLYLVTGESRTADAVAAALLDQPAVELGGVYGDLADLEDAMAQRAAPLAVVDLDPDPEQMLLDLKALLGRYPRLQVVVLCRTIEADLVLKAMRVGARHFVPKQNIETEFAEALPRLLPQNGVASRRPIGRAITVLSAGGGCGATTVAVNAAAELADIAHGSAEGARPVLLVDLDHAYGGAATSLNVTGKFGIGDVLAHDTIDAELIRSTAIPRGDRLALLASAATTHRPIPAQPTHRVLRAMDGCRAAYPWTIIDAPRIDRELAARLAARSDVTLIVMQLSVKDVRVARSLGMALAEHGVDPDRVRYVANRYRRRSVGLRFDEAREAVPGELLTLPNDFKRVAAAANAGEPLIEAAPRSALRRELRRWAQQWQDQKPAAAMPHAGADVMLEPNIHTISEPGRTIHE